MVRQLYLLVFAMLVVRANALDYLKQMQDESVDCVVTSPPYYGLRFYEGADTVWGGENNCEHEFKVNTHYTSGQSDKATTTSPIEGLEKKWVEGSCLKCGAWKGQLGLEPTVDMFIDHLLLITKEIKRVLKKTGTFFLNINDTYSGSHCGRGDNTLFQNTRRKYIADQIYNKPSPQAHSRIPEKSLMLVPERLAIRMVDEQGWILRNKIIWFKPNGLPSSAKDRFTNKWEYIFFFVKSKKYYFDLDAVRVPLKKTNYKPFNYRVREAIMGRLNQKFGSMYSASEEEKARYDRHGVRVYNSKYTLDMYLSPQDPIYLKQKLVRVASREVAKELFPNDQEKQQEIVNFVHDHYSNPKGANPGDVHQVNTKAHKFAHFAVFPEALVEPLIKAGCPENGVVLDPFAGSGTTGVVAKKLNRDAILIEISEKYVEIIKQRLASILP